jgi:hypothetical protein
VCLNSEQNERRFRGCPSDIGLEFFICEEQEHWSDPFISILEHFTSYPKRPLLYIDLSGLASLGLASFEQTRRAVTCTFCCMWRDDISLCWAFCGTAYISNTTYRTRLDGIGSSTFNRSRRGGQYVYLEMEQSNQTEPC